MPGEVGLPQFFLFRFCFLNYLDECFFFLIFFRLVLSMIKRIQVK